MATESGLEGPGLSEEGAAEAAEPVDVVELGARDDLARPDAIAVAAALHRVEAALRSNPHGFGFFQAVRLLERLRPDLGRLFEVDPTREVVRFAVNPRLSFPASEIQELTLDGAQPRMTVNFMGLIGPMGVMPHEYSLLVAERLRGRDHALADFLDMFHHRMLSLFYQAWRKQRFTIAREDGGADGLAVHLGDLIGLGLETSRERMPFPDEALIHRAGLLAGQARGAVALQQLIADFFDVGVEIEQFIGGWYPLADRDRCVIGDDEDEGNRLGFGAVAGDEIWDQQARVRVRLGPLDRAQYDGFLPGGTGHRDLAALLRYYGHGQFDFEVQLVLARDDVPGVRLGDDGADAHQLGWSTWIRSAPRSRDADETILTLNTGAAS